MWGCLFGDPKTPEKVTPNKLKHDSAFRVGVRVRNWVKIRVRRNPHLCPRRHKYYHDLE